MKPSPQAQCVCMTLLLVISSAACSRTGSDGASPSGPASGAVDPAIPASESTPTPSSATDAFAGLPYRLDLPPTWITLGSDAYDSRLDSTPEVRAWRAALGLDGQNAFRAYEPLAGAVGVQMAVNPQRTWNPSPLQDEGLVAALPGVTGEVSSDVVATGRDWKAFGYRWSETIDWGSGTPSARDCVGYFVMVDPNPANVVFCNPVGTDRVAEVEAIVATFQMTGTPVFSLPPGATPTPSPTPFDKNATPAPSIAVHAVPELEALLPDTLDGRAVAKESETGVVRGMTDDNPLLAEFGKHPADFEIAQGNVLPGATKPAAILGVTRLLGVSGDRLLAATLKSMPDAKVSQVTLGGHRVTLVEYGAWPVWMYATGDFLYSMGLGGEARAAEFFAPLP